MQKEEFIIQIQNNECDVYFCDKCEIDIKLFLSIEEFMKLAQKKNKEVYCRLLCLEKSSLFISSEVIDRLGVGSLEAYGIDSDYWEFIDTVLFPDEYDEEEDISVSEIIENLSDFERSILKRIQEYNEKIDITLLNEVCYATVFFVEEGFKIGVTEFYDCMQEYRSPFEAVRNIINQVRVESNENESDLSKKEKLIELEKKIIDDEQFWICTNQKKRKLYAEKYWFSNEYKWIRRFFCGHDGVITTHRPSDEFMVYLDNLYMKNKFRFRMNMGEQNK